MFTKQTKYVSPFGTIVEMPTLEQVAGVMLGAYSKGLVIRFNDSYDEIVIHTDTNAPWELAVDDNTDYELAELFDCEWRTAQVAHAYSGRGEYSNYIICEMRED